MRRSKTGQAMRFRRTDTILSCRSRIPVAATSMTTLTASSPLPYCTHSRMCRVLKSWISHRFLSSENWIPIVPHDFQSSSFVKRFGCGVAIRAT